MNICSAWGYFELGVFQIQGHAKLHDLDNTLRDQSIANASVTSLSVLHERLFSHGPLPLGGISSWALFLSPTTQTQEVIVKSWISTENKSLC